METTTTEKWAAIPNKELQLIARGLSAYEAKARPTDAKWAMELRMEIIEFLINAGRKMP